MAAAAAIAFGFLSWRQFAPHPTTVATDIGARRQLVLPDGSVVELNTDTAVVAAFTAGERRVRLAKGEAFFQVAKDASRPFIVEAAGVGVRAVGTAFNVRVRSESVEVLVTEGKVRVHPEKSDPPARASSLSSSERSAALATAEVAAGERVIVPVTHVAPEATPTFAVGRVGADDVRRALAWQERRLEFSDTPLGDMVAEFNRYNRHKLIVSDLELAVRRFGGSFRPDDREGFVRMLRENFGIVAEERDNSTALRAAP